MRVLRAAVVGVGYLGKFHLEKFAARDDIEVVAVVDQDLSRAEEIGHSVRVPAFADFQAIIDQVDVVSVVVPPEEHHPIAKAFLEHGVHVLVEKPMTQTLAEAEELIALAKRQGLVLQVGHLERFNPAVRAVNGPLEAAMFIEAHRLAPFQPRGARVNVIFDLMVHDIDIVLHLVSSEVVDIRATGVPVLTNDIDIVNARLEFQSGCVANLTSSRVTPTAMRKIRVFQPDTYLSIDSLTNQLGIAKKVAGQGEVTDQSQIKVEQRRFDKIDALQLEIDDFVSAVRENRPPEVTGEDGKRALSVALAIDHCIKENWPKIVGSARQ